MKTNTAVLGHWSVGGNVRISSNERPGIWFPNSLLYSWGAIVARLLAEGRSLHRIAAMYIEFANVASPGDPVSIPTFDRTRDLSYYVGLSDSPDRDYILAPLTSATVYSSDDNLFPLGNTVLFSARTVGSVGIHGKEFSYDANSVVVGGALVATPHPVDRTQDLLLSAFYAPVNEQRAKPAAGLLTVDWEKSFE